VNQMGGWNCYKVSEPFLERFRRENGYDLCGRLPWLDEDRGAESLRIRHDYFRSLNNALYNAQSDFVAQSRRLFGEKMFPGSITPGSERQVSTTPMSAARTISICPETCPAGLPTALFPTKKACATLCGWPLLWANSIPLETATAIPGTTIPRGQDRAFH